MEVLAVLKDEGASVTHGWTYIDPVEQKPRQYDMRCLMKEPAKQHRCLRLSVECKNIDPDFPLVITGCARTRAESVHDYLHTLSTAPEVVYTVAGRSELYPENEFVGKNIVRVGWNKEQRAYAVLKGESDVYLRWSQALASAHELCEMGANEQGYLRTAVLPVVVVPENSLWTVRYSASGAIEEQPKQVRGTTIFVNHEVGMNLDSYRVYLSHVHFLTPSGLRDLLSPLLADRKTSLMAWDRFFPAGATYRDRKTILR